MVDQHGKLNELANAHSFWNRAVPPSCDPNPPFQLEGSGVKELALPILIADPHALFRGGMHFLLEQLPYAVNISEVATGTELIDAVRKDHFNLIMLELLMPDMDSGLLLDRIRNEAPDTPLIIVSATDQISTIRRSVEGGASGFVPKTSDPHVLIQAVIMVLAGGIYVPPCVLSATEALSHGTSNSIATSIAYPLTGRQMSILQLLGDGLSNKQIARHLDISEGTVKSHLAGLLKILGAKNRTQAIIFAAQLGLVKYRDRPTAD